jgi:hypothetical protein
VCSSVVAGASSSCLSRDDVIIKDDSSPLLGPSPIALPLALSLSRVSSSSLADSDAADDDLELVATATAASADDVIARAASGDVRRRSTSHGSGGGACVIVNSAVCAPLVNGFGDSSGGVLRSTNIDVGQGQGRLPMKHAAIGYLPRVCSIDTVVTSLSHTASKRDIDDRGGGESELGGGGGELRGRLVKHGGSDGHCLAALKKAISEQGQGQGRGQGRGPENAKSLSSVCLRFKDTTV